jgi:hydrogenase maturation protease
VDADYQLNVEDAAEVAAYDRVIFVDADCGCKAPFRVEKLSAAERKVDFSTHSISPEGVLTLARDLFGAEPEAYLIGIRGYEFNAFGEDLTDMARSNLAAAVSFLESAFSSGGWGEAAAATTSTPAGVKSDGR